ncbi:MAG: hypothetical protein KAV83_01585 [Desulfobacterales bacterium]|nr:hypothetical protein [Desulfobacterales bacterium]
MFPFIFDWVSDASHFVFMGTLYAVMGLLVIALHYCGIRAFFDWLCKKGQHEH